MTLPERLAKKWCEWHNQADPTPYEDICICDEIMAAVREALEKARSVIEGHIKELRTFKLARNTYVPAIVRELEIVSEKLKTLEGEIRDV